MEWTDYNIESYCHIIFVHLPKGLVFDNILIQKDRIAQYRSVDLPMLGVGVVSSNLVNKVFEDAIYLVSIHCWVLSVLWSLKIYFCPLASVEYSNRAYIDMLTYVDVFAILKLKSQSAHFTIINLKNISSLTFAILYVHFCNWLHCVLYSKTINPYCEHGRLHRNKFYSRYINKSISIKLLLYFMLLRRLGLNPS